MFRRIIQSSLVKSNRAAFSRSYATISGGSREHAAGASFGGSQPGPSGGRISSGTQGVPRASSTNPVSVKATKAATPSFYEERGKDVGAGTVSKAEIDAKKEEHLIPKSARISKEELENLPDLDDGEPVHIWIGKEARPNLGGEPTPGEPQPQMGHVPNYPKKSSGLDPEQMSNSRRNKPSAKHTPGEHTPSGLQRG